MAAVPRGALLAVTGRSAVVALWDLRAWLAGSGTPEFVRRLEASVGDLDVLTASSDGTRLLAGSRSGRILVRRWWTACYVCHKYILYLYLYLHCIPSGCSAIDIVFVQVS